MPATATSESAIAGVEGYLAAFERFERALSEPAGLTALRRQAIARFAELGFPTLRQEEWRLTNVAPVAQGAFHWPEGDPDAVPSGRLAPHVFDAAARLVFVDGRFSPRLSSLGELPQGVIVASLSEMLARDPERLEPWLARFAKFDRHPFVALNTAFLRDGAFVYVPRGAVTGPIHLLFLSSGEEGRSTLSFPRNLFVAGEGSQTAIVETYAGEGSYFTAPVTELVAGPNAVIDHYKVQRESLGAFHLATFQVQGERASVPSSHSISIGGALVRNDVNAVLDGEGIDCILNGLYFGDGRQIVDNHMRVEHAKPHCASHELYKGVLDGKSRAVFNGLIHVHKGAQKTDAKQSNRNLLLSRDAIANSNPQLEIFADDVKCTHGSTVGQLDEDAVFYLRSRGISEDEARRLVVHGFFNDLIRKIEVPELRERLESVVEAELARNLLAEVR